MSGLVLSTLHCELEPCLVGDWERGRIAGCLGVGVAAGWGETEVLMDVSSPRRLAPVQHRRLPARGLLSLPSSLRAFLLTVIKRTQGWLVDDTHMSIQTVCDAAEWMGQQATQTNHGGIARPLQVGSLRRLASETSTPPPSRYVSGSNNSHGSPNSTTRTMGAQRGRRGWQPFRGRWLRRPCVAGAARLSGATHA